MAVKTGRDTKIFICGVEVTKELAVKGFNFNINVDVEGLTELDVKLSLFYDPENHFISEDTNGCLCYYIGAPQKNKRKISKDMFNKKKTGSARSLIF
jgi:hypothetical protein